MEVLGEVVVTERVAGDPEVSVMLCDDDFMRDLNRRYRDTDRTTDVLSFAQDTVPVAGAQVLGDIVISLPTAARQAGQAGWSLDDEIALLAVHGLLHLLGHDDETLEGALDMQRRTVAALTRSGYTLPAGGSHPFLKEIEPADATSSAT